MESGKLDTITINGTMFGVPHSDQEWTRADLGDGWLRFISGTKEFKVHPSLMAARYRDNEDGWTAEPQDMEATEKTP